MKDSAKDLLKFILRLVVSVGLLWFIFSKINFAQTKDVVSRADLNFIWQALGVFLLINVFLLTRWYILVKALDLNVRTISIVRYFFVGLFGNLFLPSSVGGDLIKIYGMCKETTFKPRVVASVLLDRLSGFAAIVIVSTLAFFGGYNYIENKFLLVPIVVLAILSLGVGAVLFNETIYGFGCSIFNKFPKIKETLMKLHYDISLLKGRRAEGYKAIAISCLSQITFSLVFFLIAKALHQDIPFIYFLIFVPFICVVSSFPSIGGLGIREMGAAYMFSKIGVDNGIAVSISLVNFLFMILVGLIGGLVYVCTLSAGRIQHPAQASGADLRKA